MLGTGTALGNIAKLCCLAPVVCWGDPQGLANRFDSEAVAMLIDGPLQDLKRRSSSAWAKKAVARFRISLAQRSSLTSQFSALMRSRSSVLTPSRTPRPT